MKIQQEILVLQKQTEEFLRSVWKSTTAEDKITDKTEQWD